MEGIMARLLKARIVYQVSQFRLLMQTVRLISADHDRAQRGRVRRRQNNGRHKYCTKTHEEKWPLDFISGKYDCAGDDHQ
jgi:hypothetical protein